MADDKKSSGDDGFIRTESGVREAFDNAKGGISAGAIGGIVATVTLGLVLLLVLIASSEAVHNNPTPEARQDAQIRIVVLGLMLFFAVLIFIGIVFLVT